MVRERVEEREERALGESSRHLQRAKAKKELLLEELEVLGRVGMARVGSLWSGAEIRERDTEMRSLKERLIAAAEEIKQLEEQHLQQMQRYRAAHADSEAINELQEQKRLAHLAMLGGRERKASEELFLGRRTISQQRLEQEIVAP